MSPKRSKPLKEIHELAAQVSENLCMNVEDLQFLVEHEKRILRITISKEGGVTLDDCADFSRSLGKLLDRDEVIKDKYFLEVQSPGIKL